jgi:hypothetical protein
MPLVRPDGARVPPRKQVLRCICPRILTATMSLIGFYDNVTPDKPLRACCPLFFWLWSMTNRRLNLFHFDHRIQMNPHNSVDIILLLYHFDHKFTGCYTLPPWTCPICSSWTAVMRHRNFFKFISTSSWRILAQKSAWQPYLGHYSNFRFTKCLDVLRVVDNGTCSLIKVWCKCKNNNNIWPRIFWK